MKKFLLLLPILLLSACNLNKPQIEVEVISDRVEVAEEEFVCGQDKVKDTDGNEYKTAYFDIDGGHDMSKEGQCWMAENLNVGTKILNPGEEPSDDGVIEKWCMTDDWSADFIFDCDVGGGGGWPDICFERAERRKSREVKSSKYNCNGGGEIPGYGGLYAWTEVTNDKQAACPSDWSLPTRKNWVELESNIRKGISYEKFLEDYPEFKGHPEFKKKVPIAFYLMKEPFNAVMAGIYFDEQMMRKDKATRLLSVNAGATLLETFSNGNPTMEREIQYMKTLDKKSLKNGYSVRCIKK